MKIIKYRLMTEVNHGTEEEPSIMQTFNDCEIQCSDDSDFESNYAIALKEAYNGEVTVEEVPDPPHEPTQEQEQRITALEEQMALADETAIELFEAQMAQEEINLAQDDALIELYEMMEGA